jgi:hypothetical protein
MRDLSSRNGPPRPVGAEALGHGVPLEKETHVWRRFDKIFCISVDERTDRRASATDQFTRLGVLPLVEFVIVPRHPVDIEQGIYESHLACMKKGIDSGAETMLIFEDDVVFERYRPETLTSCTDFLSRQRKWDMLFLGCLVSGSWSTSNRSVLRVRYRCLTHACVVHRPFAEKLVGKPWAGVAYDDTLCAMAGEYFAAYPSFAFQSNSPSDNIRHLRLDRVRRLLGGMRRIQTRNEWYHRHRLAIIALHMAAILLVLLVLLAGFR